MSELKWFLYAFIGLWVLWLVTGGPTHYESKTRQLLEQPAPIQGWRPYTIQELKNQ